MGVSVWWVGWAKNDGLRCAIRSFVRMKMCAEQNDVCTIVEDVWGDNGA